MACTCSSDCSRLCLDCLRSLALEECAGSASLIYFCCLYSYSTTASFYLFTELLHHCRLKLGLANSARSRRSVVGLGSAAPRAGWPCSTGQPSAWDWCLWSHSDSSPVPAMAAEYCSSFSLDDCRLAFSQKRTADAAVGDRLGESSATIFQLLLAFSLNFISRYLMAMASSFYLLLCYSSSRLQYSPYNLGVY